eukprot:10461767-Alexandrium_andersonii.AAC.1
MKTVKRDHRQLVSHASVRSRLLACCKVDNLALDTDDAVSAVHVFGNAPYSRGFNLEVNSVAALRASAEKPGPRVIVCFPFFQMLGAR